MITSRVSQLPVKRGLIRTRTRPPIGARRLQGVGNFVAVPYLQTWTDCKPIGGLSGFVDAPWFTKWPDGRPIARPGSSAKRDLVAMALSRATAKKSGGLRGLGVMVYDPSTGTYIDAGTPETIDTSLPTSIDQTYYDPYGYNVSVTAPPYDVQTIDTPLPTSIPYLTPPTFPTSSGIPSWTYPATQQQVQSAQTQGLLYNILAPLASIFGNKANTAAVAQPAVYQQPASVTSSLQSGLNSMTSGLSQRPFASVPISYGGLLLLGGGAIVLTSLMRRGGRRR